MKGIRAIDPKDLPALPTSCAVLAPSNSRYYDFASAISRSIADNGCSAGIWLMRSARLLDKSERSLNTKSLFSWAVKSTGEPNNC
nr:hypothetical protein [Nostoc sp. DedSLP05]